MALLALTALLAGCGVPTDGPPETIARSDIPYGLTSSSPTSATATSSPARRDRPCVYLVGRDDVLVPSGREVSGTNVRERLSDLLGQLAAGPTEGERNEQFATALPPGTTLDVSAIDGDVATVELGGKQAPSGQQSRRAVAQIVLTSTSLPQIGAVVLTRDGAPLEAPLPSGELTTAPLTAADYDRMLVAPPS